MCARPGEYSVAVGVANPKYHHLPPHREPGEQSETARLSGGFAMWLCGAVGAFFFVMCAYLYSLRHGAAWEGKSIWGVEIFLGSCGLLALGLAYWARLRRQSPRMARHFAVRVDRQDLRRGEPLAVTLTVRNAAKVTGKLQVGLVAVERYDEEVTTYNEGVSSTQRQTIENPVFEQWTPADPALSSQSFRISVPADKYCSYEGECFSLAWRVAVREVRAQRRDPHSHVPIWVTP